MPTQNRSIIMVKVWFPNMFMRLISWKPNRTPPQALFNISPRMTKTEVKEYCNKIYGVPVVKVMTANYLGSAIFYIHQ